MVIEKWSDRWLRYTNHVIAWTVLHCARPLALWGFLQHLPAQYRCRPKSYHLSAEPLGVCAIW